MLIALRRLNDDARGSDGIRGGDFEMWFWLIPPGPFGRDFDGNVRRVAEFLVGDPRYVSVNELLVLRSAIRDRTGVLKGKPDVTRMVVFIEWRQALFSPIGADSSGLRTDLRIENQQRLVALCESLLASDWSARPGGIGLTSKG